MNFYELLFLQNISLFVTFAHIKKTSVEGKGQKRYTVWISFIICAESRASELKFNVYSVRDILSVKIKSSSRLEDFF